MTDIIETKVERWSVPQADRDIIQVNQQINFLVKKLFFYYEPTIGPELDFWKRLATWLDDGLNEEDQKLLFRLIPMLFFVGREEFDALYRAAYNGPVARWLFDGLGVKLCDPSTKNRLQDAVAKTWFCPFTDSMRINAFYHVNNITTGMDFRPDWRSLLEFGSEKKICEFINDNQIEHLVLLEDFVGSGSQAYAAAEFAAKLPCSISVLVLPLIVCPKGVENGEALARAHKGKITFSNVLSLKNDAFIAETAMPKEPLIFAKLRDLIMRTYGKVCGGTELYSQKPYGPFGFCDTGGLIVLYSNCPDNSLPIIHHKSSTWSPLFPRASRV